MAGLSLRGDEHRACRPLMNLAVREAKALSELLKLS